MATVSVVLLASQGGAALARTLDSIHRQVSESLAVEVIVAVPARGEREANAIAALSTPRGARVQTFTNLSPGGIINACLAEAGGDYVILLDEGDEVPGGVLQAGAAALRDGAAVAAVPWSWVAGFERLETVTPTARDREQALAVPHLAPAVFLFRRASWQQLGGFDDRLPALAEYDFLLRLFDHGAAVVLDGPPVRRHLSRNSRLRHEFEPGIYQSALALVLARHQALLERDPAQFMVERERESAALLAHHRVLVARRDDAVRRTSEARAETLELRGFLRGHGRDGVDWGELRHAWPLSREWGYDRGTPLDRVFIERFVADHATDIHGRVLEVQENDLTRRFGGSAVTGSDVVDITPQNPRATVIADLRRAPGLPDETYDCIILTQTLHVIDDVAAVLRECRRMLKPGGVLLATFPAASRVCVEYGPDADFWRATEAGARRLCASVFGEAAVVATSFGNVLTTTAFLQGVSAHELAPTEFDEADPAHPTLIGLRAVKPSVRMQPANRQPGTAPVVRGRGAILLYHRVATLDDDLHGLSVQPEQFAAEMDFITNSYLPIPLGELVDAGVQRRLPHGAVAVTFDDGYRDNLANAAPILAKRGMPATFFIPAGILGEAREFWWDTLARVLGADRAAHDEMYRGLVHGTRQEIERAIDELCASRGVPRAEPQTMTREQILELAASPLHTIGAHGVDHLYLPAQSEQARRDELFYSRRAIEDLLGRDVRWVAYPFGSHDQASCEAARDAGYDGALTCDARAWTEGEDPYRIPRVEVRCRSIGEFEALLRGLLE